MTIRVCLLAAGKQSRSGQICAKSMTLIDGVPVLAYLVDAIPGNYPVDVVALKDNPSVRQMERVIHGRGKTLLLDASKSQGDTMRQYARVMPCSEIIYMSADTYPCLPLLLRLPAERNSMYYDPFENISILRVRVDMAADSMYENKLDYAARYLHHVRFVRLNCINVNGWEDVHRIMKSFHNVPDGIMVNMVSQDDLG